MKSLVHILEGVEPTAITTTDKTLYKVWRKILKKVDNQ